MKRSELALLWAEIEGGLSGLDRVVEEIERALKDLDRMLRETERVYVKAVGS
ncbi:hypothetical protein [Thermodesulforhabdus norvegica]|uniref:Uncharacterized protein n=1 Tax=Thermodesulforhabdus norvegica TaxID=39841 RepID=A0A1I4TW64_9BACT|nr:hypothetical protein [Thermodesulforhabdus norvegica]SFM80793.1 hypothetical protein SAMN05660836_01549 [Thermodesulforhabdus norvegica]